MILYFFGPQRLNHMKRDSFGFFFYICSDSLNMNDIEFSFSGLIKLNIERPVLGSNPSSLRFVKHMSLDLSSDKLYRVFVSLFELIKLKRGTHRSWWGKWEGNHFVNNESCLSVPLNMALVCTIMSVNWVFSWSLWWSTFMSYATPLSLSKECIVHCRIVCLSHLFMLPSILLCRPMFKGKLKMLFLYSQNSLCVRTFESFLWLLHLHHSRTMFQVSCRRCGTHHGPLSTRLFPLTSAHHLGNSLRNKNLVPWDLYALMIDSLTLDIGSHHWPLIYRTD